jgi:hypothetical protein
MAVDEDVIAANAHRSRNGTPRRFLFVTLGHVESDFYGRVGAELLRGGDEVAHLTYSRRAAQVLRRRGCPAWSLPELIDQLPELDGEAEAARIAEQYAVVSFRDIYRTDIACEDGSEAAAVARTVGHVVAIERLLDEWRPDVVVPEVGNETIRVAAAMVAVQRRIPVLYLLYTIFPHPLRLYVDTLHAPIVRPDELRPLTGEEDAELDAFMAEFKRKERPIRPPREVSVTAHRLRMLGRHLVVKALWDRDNDYLSPVRWVRTRLIEERVRRLLARRRYESLPHDRRLVYFPLHVTDDYKIKRLIPHLADQGAIIEQVANALPHGVDLVVKEHPMSIGRTPLQLIDRLAGLPNVRVVRPDCNTHELIDRSEAVIVISSTVGLEALLYDKPVLTLGAPFYAGAGVTLDADSTADVPALVPQVLDFRPDPAAIRRFVGAAMRRCKPGAPVLVDRSDDNAVVLAHSLAEGAREALADRERLSVART